MSLLPTSMEDLGAGRLVRVARLGAANGQPPVVLLHGYPDNLQIWCRLAPLLVAGGRAVIAFDWPGMGDSPAWPGGTTPELQAGRLVVLLDHWGVARAELLAMDMGGQPALVCAALHPTRIARLTVMNSLVLADGPTSWDIRLLRRYGWNRWLLRRLPWLVFQRAMRTSLPWGTALPVELRDDLWRGFSRPEVRAFITRLCAGYQATLPALATTYPRITCPLLLLWGTRDAHFPPAQAQRLQTLISGAQLRLLPAGRHWMAWQLADQVADAVNSFSRG